jgi:hypothetical protein
LISASAVSGAAQQQQGTRVPPPGWAPLREDVEATNGRKWERLEKQWKRAGDGGGTLAAESQQSKAERHAQLLAHPRGPPYHGAGGSFTPEEVLVLRE